MEERYQPLGTVPLTNAQQPQAQAALGQLQQQAAQQPQSNLSLAPKPNPGSYGATNVGAAGSAMRFQTFTPGAWNPQMQGMQLSEIQNAVLSGRKPIAGTDLSGARSMYAQGANRVGQANIGSQQQIAGTDLSRARADTGASRGEIGNAQIGQYGAIAGTNLDGVYSSLDQANQRIQGTSLRDLDRIEAGSYDPSSEAGRSRQITMDLLERLGGAPDRRTMAADTFNLLREESRPAYEQDLRTVGQRAGALGRVGAGMTTNELTDVYTTRERDLDLNQRRLALEAGNLEMSDMLGRLDASSAAASRFGDEDRANATMSQSLRDEGRQERGYQADREQAQVGLDFDKGSFARDSANDIARYLASQRQEQVGERDFAAGQDESRARLALDRGGALRDLAAQEQGFAGIERGDAESDRNYLSDYNQRRADFDLRAGESLGGFGDREAELASILRGDAENDRNYDLDYDTTNADLAFRRAGEYGAIDDTNFGREERSRNEFRTEREWQEYLADREYQRWLELQKLNLEFA